MDENAIETVGDSETTGLDPAQGHRVIELACVRLVGLLPTGEEFRKLINPGRPIPPDSTEIHGITDEMVRGHPPFRAIAREFLAFIGDGPFVAHNAEFDARFINHELSLCGLPPLPPSRFIDTMPMARRKLGGTSWTLDALCRKYKIDLSVRKQHGALVDSRLLAQVYLNLNGGRARSFDFGAAVGAGPGASVRPGSPKSHTARASEARHRAARALGMASEADLARHAAHVIKLKDGLWPVPGCSSGSNGP